MTDNQYSTELQSAIEAFENSEFAECANILDALQQDEQINQDALANVYFLKGQLNHTLKNLDEAIDSYNKLLALKPADRGYNNLGVIYEEIGLYDKAIECLQNALAKKPDTIEYLMHLASCYRKQYNNEKAEEIYRKILALKPDNTKVYRRITLCTHYQTLDNDDFKNIHRILKEKTLSNDQLEQCYFALGKIYNDCNDYDNAFQYHELGNNIRKQTRFFNLDKHADKIYGLMDTFKPEYFEHFTDIGNYSSKPVFIIGLSRAGKTLIERLLNHHPLVADKEELAVLNKIVDNALNDSEIASQLHLENEPGPLPKSTLKQLAEEYLEHLTKNIDVKATKITDTTPSNYRYIGYINVLFPNAKIIWSKRNPLDHCVQMYFKYYKKGHYFTYDKKILADYYVLYLEMMEYWKRVSPIPILEIQHEELILDPISAQKKLYNYLELPIKEEYFNKIELTHQELERWRHFEKHLKPFKKRLKSYLNYESSVKRKKWI